MLNKEFIDCVWCKTRKLNTPANFPYQGRGGGFYWDWCANCWPIAPSPSKIKAAVGSGSNRARKYGVSENTLNTREWTEVLSASKGYCCYCNQFFGFKVLTIEHIIPLSSGGANAQHNVAASCRACNTTPKKYETQIKKASAGDARLKAVSEFAGKEAEIEGQISKMKNIIHRAESQIRSLDGRLREVRRQREVRVKVLIMESVKDTP